MSQKLLSLLFIGLLQLGLLIKADHVFANPVKDGDDVIIIFFPSGDESTNPPRTPFGPQIEAYYSWNTSSVSASLSNAGDEVEVEFNNLSTGEHYYFEISGNGLSVMPISSSLGYWTVSFILADGTVHSAGFVI